MHSLEEVICNHIMCVLEYFYIFKCINLESKWDAEIFHCSLVRYRLQRYYCPCVARDTSLVHLEHMHALGILWILTAYSFIRPSVHSCTHQPNPIHSTPTCPLICLLLYSATPYTNNNAPFTVPDPQTDFISSPPPPQFTLSLSYQNHPLYTPRHSRFHPAWFMLRMCSN
jgi:hypothetical protein